MNITVKKKKDIKTLLFYISLVAYPLLQFFVFYIIVNANSIALAFKDYTFSDGHLTQTFVGFKNIANVYKDLFTNTVFITAARNSFIFYLLSVVFGVGVSLLFSYYIYKKRLFAGFYKTILYLPHIVSGMVITIMYKYFLEKGLPAIALTLTGNTIKGFSANPTTEFLWILVYSAYLGCGANMLIYTSTMGGISDSVIEAAQIDGANTFREFINIIIPAIFPTFSLFIVTGMLTIFTGQGNLFNFYGLEADTSYYTFGYYLYVQVKQYAEDYTHYPYLAAFGLSLTFIAIPLIFSGRWLLKKYGPSTD